MEMTCCRYMTTVYSTPAVMPTCPSRLNQPVTQEKSGPCLPPRVPAQKYTPPDVGSAEHTSAIGSATISVIVTASGQPHVTDTGPPCVKP